MQGELGVVHEAVASLRVDGVQDSYRLNPPGWAKDVLGVHLWSKQREITESVRDHKRTVVASCHGSGKALALGTELPTPTGWTTMGEVRPGDELIGVDGKAAKVLAVTPEWEVDTYEVVFSDGSTITCSGDHEWNTLPAKVRNRIRVQCHRDDMAVDWSCWWHLAETYTTVELAESLRTNTYEHNHAVPLPSGIEGTETAFVEAPYEMATRYGPTNMVGDKLLRSAKWQRWEFIQGLADRLAHVDRTGAVVFMLTDPLDAERTVELVRASGKAMVTRRYEDKSGNWRVVARIEESPFAHNADEDARWRERNHGKRTYSRNTARMIVDVRRVPTVKTKCVQVDAPHNLYLAGREMVPTHNSMIASVISAWFVSVHPPGQAIVITTAPTYHQVNAILWEELRKHHRSAQAAGLPLPGKITQDNQWKLSDGTLIGMGRKPADGDAHAFQGIHRPYVLVVIDEACHDDQTDVLTDQGWKRFADLDGSERLLTMDAQTHEAYYDKPVKLVSKPYSGPMHYYSAKGLNYAVTPDHTMLYGQRKHGKPLDWRTQERQEIATWSNKCVKKVIDWTQSDDPALTDDWLTFLGWFGSEGSINKDLTRVCITQSAEREAYQRIFALCERLGFNPKKHGDHVLINSTKLARELAQWGRTQLVRRVPDFVRNASARQIGVYLDAYAEGDGYWHGTREVIYTSSPQMADDLQELILKTGMPSVVSKRELAGKQTTFPDGHVATSSVDGYVVTRPYRSSNAKMYNENEQVSHYEGMVYCATMPKDHLLFTRRNGYTMWSGNCGVPEELWTGVEAITTTANSRILAIGNPDDRDTEFGRVFLDERYASMWNRISIPASVTPNFTGEPVPMPLPDVLVQRDWVDERRRAWTEDDPRYMSKVEAKFPEQGVMSLFGPAVLARGFDQDNLPKPDGKLKIGVDPARFGDDRTTVVARRGRLMWVVDSWQGMDTVQTAHKVMNLADELREVDDNGKKAEFDVEIRVDVVGLGAGVVDTLAFEHRKLEAGGQAWFTVIEMNGAAAPPLEQGGSVQGYGNARAYWYDKLKQGMANGSRRVVEHELARDELEGIRFNYRTSKMYIETKEEMRKRGVKSPDYADGMVYASAEIFDGPQDGDTMTSPAEDIANAELEEMLEAAEMMISPY